MSYVLLAVERAEISGWIELRTTSAVGLVERHALELNRGFTLEHVEEALLAMPWIERDGMQYRLDASVSCQRLGECLAEMLTYFTSPGAPAAPLLRVVEAVERHLAGMQDRPLIPHFAFAWLDIMVRDEAADAARSSDDIWSDHALTLDLAHARDKHIAALLQRFAGNAAAAPHMEPSRRTRPPQSEHKAG